MKRKSTTLTLTLLAACTFGLSAPVEAAQGNAPTAQARKQSGSLSQHPIQDRDFDGKCDLCRQSTSTGLKNSQGVKAKKGNHWGPSDLSQKGPGDRGILSGSMGAGSGGSCSGVPGMNGGSRGRGQGMGGGGGQGGRGRP